VRTKVPIFCRPAFVLILLFVSLTSCPMPDPMFNKNVSEHWVTVVYEKRPTTTLPWLVDGKTTKEEVIRNENFRDVKPRSLSQEKILVYCIDWDEKKSQFVGSTTCSHQLVLVFDEKDILKRFSILKMD
jgi:hypothetical protein